MLNWLKKNIFNRPIAFYPILFAAFPAFFLYAYNISISAADHLVIPLTLSTLGTIILWILLGLIIRDMRKAALAATIFIILFFSYGRIFTALEAGNFFLPVHAYLISIILFAWGYCVYFIKIAHSNFKNITVILNVVAVTLIVINLANIGWYELHKPRESTADPVQNNYIEYSKNSTSPDFKPDIYYIVLDEYAHGDTMAEYYNYDNSDILKSLESLDFYIAGKSKSPSLLTDVSIASVLNMQRLDDSTQPELIERRIANNEVVNFLKSKGYTYVYFEAYSDSRGAKYGADQYYDFYRTSENTRFSEFGQIFWNTTMLRPFYNRISGEQFRTYHRDAISNTLYTLNNLPNTPGPKFVLAHLMCPHEPFVFGQNGEPVNPASWYNYDDKSYYLDQYIYISRSITYAVTEILNKSSDRAVIIIQSDHGLRPRTEIEIRPNEWEKIFNAYHFPGKATDTLYDSISPVNSFRLIFNQYFHTELPLLTD